MLSPLIEKEILTQLDKLSLEQQLQVLNFAELWRYNGRVLQINVLQYGKYVETKISPNFPAFPLIEVIPQYLEQSKTIGRNSTIKAFRNWVRERL